MNIAYLTNMLSKPTDSGGNIHVMQVARNLRARGHRLYSNLQHESDDFVKFKADELEKIAGEIDVFYIRIHGHHKNDELTALRRHNPRAACVWEINAPLEELLVAGCDAAEFQRLNAQRKDLATEVDAAVCVSVEMEDYALNDLGIPLTTCIPNGSDTSMFSPKSASAKGNVELKVIWVGSQKFPWQGFDVVRKAAERLSTIDSSIRFIVTADGTSTQNLEYVGHVPYHDLPLLMSEADVGLCIYEDVTFYHHFFFSPLKLYDYMASGLAIIGTNKGQIRQVITETGNGILVDDVGSLVDAIIRLKNNKSLLNEYAARSRFASEIYYNWERVASRTERFMEKVTRVKQLSNRETSVASPPLESRRSMAGLAQRLFPFFSKSK